MNKLPRGPLAACIQLLCWLAPVPTWAAACVGVAAAGGGSSFWKSMEAGAGRAGAELGVQVVFRGPADEGDIQAQRKIVDYLVSLGCKSLVIAPNASVRNEDVRRLIHQGHAVVYVDRDAGTQDIPLVATDNRLAGQKAGMEMAGALKGRGRVLVLGMSPDVRSTSERLSGFAEAAVRAGLSINGPHYLGTTIGEARSQSRRLLSELRGQFDAVFTPNESTTLATLLALRELGLDGTVLHLGFDMRPEFAEAIRAGSLLGVMVQKPFEMGYRGVKLSMQLFNGERLGIRQILLESEFVSPASLEAYLRSAALQSGP